MKNSKIVLAGLMGGAVAFLLGFLVYGVLLYEFFQNNTLQAINFQRGNNKIMWIPLLLGHLSWGLFFAYIFGHWAHISTFITGMKAGAILGFLVAFTFDMITLGTTNTMNVTATMVNILVTVIISAFVAGVVAWLLGKDASK